MLRHLNKLAGVERHPVKPDFVMDMGAGRTPGITGGGDQITAFDALSDLHHQLGIVAVIGFVAVTMIDNDQFAIAIFCLRPADNTCGRGVDRGADAGGNIDPFMHGALVAEGGLANAEI